MEADISGQEELLSGKQLLLPLLSSCRALLLRDNWNPAMTGN